VSYARHAVFPHADTSPIDADVARARREKTRYTPEARALAALSPPAEATPMRGAEVRRLKSYFHAKSSAAALFR